VSKAPQTIEIPPFPGGKRIAVTTSWDDAACTTGASSPRSTSGGSRGRSTSIRASLGARARRRRRNRAGTWMPRRSPRCSRATRSRSTRRRIRSCRCWTPRRSRRRSSTTGRRWRTSWDTRSAGCRTRSGRTTRRSSRFCGRSGSSTRGPSRTATPASRGRAAGVAEHDASVRREPHAAPATVGGLLRQRAALGRVLRVGAQLRVRPPRGWSPLERIFKPLAGKA